MKKERVIKFEKGKLFGPKLTHPIDENDFFIDCYYKASQQILEILSGDSRNGLQLNKVKNIIAFLGERGQGKTSIMLSFVKALEEKNRILFSNSLDNYEFISLDVVDPSTFEDCSTVLDSILGQLLSKVRDAKDYENYYDDINDIYRNFDDIYMQFDIIKDKTLLKKDFNIYDGSIETLIMVDKIINFKRSLKSLIDDCLRIITKYEKKTYKKPILLIPIDDVDIDMKNCYEALETIRKYLTIPGVIIVMAAKLEQLHEGIRIEKLKDVTHSTVDSDRTYEDIYNMTSKYLLKLLPQNRRIHIPYLVNNTNLLQYDVNYDMEGIENFIQLESSIAQLLYKKTGIILLCTNQIHNYLITNNLRDVIDLYACLNDMDDPTGDEYVSKYICNIGKFKDYFFNNWCTNNLNYNSARIVRRLYNEGGIYKNHTLIQILYKLTSDDKDAKKFLRDLLEQRGKKELFYDLSDISYILNKIENHKFDIKSDNISKFAYAIKLTYTIIMNQLYYIDKYKQEYNNLENGYLMKFIGGRILRSDILNRFKDDNGSILTNDGYAFSKIISNKIKGVYDDNLKNYDKIDVNCILIKLLSATSYDKKRNIYFYSTKNQVSDVYFDPALFFVNGIDFKRTCNFLYNSKFNIHLVNNINSELKEMISEKNNNIEMLNNYADKIIEEINKVYNIKNDLELVSKSVICNFQLYDFFIDSLDLRYLPAGHETYKLSEFYLKTVSWLHQLSNDLKTQYPQFSGSMDIIFAIENIKKLLEDLSKKLDNLSITVSDIIGPAKQKNR